MVRSMENKDELLELETQRALIHKQTRLLSLLAFVLIIAGIGVCFVLFFLSFVFFIAGVVILCVVTAKRKKFRDEFKELVVKKLITSELGVDAVYRRQGGISLSEINSLQVASVPDKYQMEDYISCVYNGVPYEMCDCTLQERVVTTDANGHTHVTYQNYFKGRVIKIDFKRDLNIVLKVVNRPVRGFQAQGLEKFETEVIEFNKHFKCYANTKEAGFYVLTPMMIQKMQELERMYVGGIFYVIMHGNLYVLINNNGDSLEVNISKPLDGKQLDRIKADILIGASIINEFRMDSDKYNVNR